MSDASPKFYLQWNFINWITVILMAGIGMMFVGAIASGVRQYSKRAGNSDAA